MKYRKNKAKDYAPHGALKGVWTALPSNFTDDDRLDEAGERRSISSTASPSWSSRAILPRQRRRVLDDDNQERMRVHEINVEVAKGRVPIIAGCHHQNPNEVVNSASMPGLRRRFRHHTDALRRVQRRRRRLRVLQIRGRPDRHRHRALQYPDRPIIPITEKLAKRLATIPNICGFKQGGPATASTIDIRAAVGKDVV